MISKNLRKKDSFFYKLMTQKISTFRFYFQYKRKLLSLTVYQSMEKLIKIF